MTQQIRPAILTVLASLRGKIRRYVFLEGIALVLCSVAFLFWLGLSINWAYFKVSHLELPKWFRVLFNIGSLCLIVLTFLVWVVTRTLRHFRTKSLALILEQHFPELDDRLITAVEVEQSSSEYETRLTEEMRSLTVSEVSQDAKSLDIGKVFSKIPLMRAIIVAGVLFFSIGILWVVKVQAVENWYNAFIKMDDVYWQRETKLETAVLAYPGERIKHFKAGSYKHPEGGDLVLVVKVPEGINETTGKPWVIPERVNITFHRIGKDGTFKKKETRSCNNTGDREFRLKIDQLDDSINVWVEGGDFVNREPYRVHVVPPPTIDGLDLLPYYPVHTGLNSSMVNGVPQPVKVIGAELVLPIETQFIMQADFNKPIHNVRIDCGRYSISFGHFPSSNPAAKVEAPFMAKLYKTSKDGTTTKQIPLSSQVAQTFLSTDGKRLQIPLIMTATSSGEGETLPKEKHPMTPVFHVSPGSKMEIHMEDRDDITSILPVTLAVNGIEDKPPVIEAETIGVSSVITREASLPVKGFIVDDYGILKAYFEYRVDDEEQGRIRRFQSPPQNSPQSFQLEQTKDWMTEWAGDEPVERFSVKPLDLKIGQKLTLNVFAEDGDTLNGPHFNRGALMVFTIVSKEDLLAKLYQDEMSLRANFVRVISEMEQVRAELNNNLDQLAQLSDLRNKGERSEAESKKLTQLLQSLEVGADKEFNLSNENHKNNKDIAADFKKILQELVNNNAHTRQDITRLRDTVVVPLNNLNKNEFPELRERLTLFRKSAKTESTTQSQIEGSLEVTDTILSGLNKILQEMEDLMNFHKLIVEITEIKTTEEELRERVRLKQKDEAIKKLKELEGDE